MEASGKYSPEKFYLKAPNSFCFAFNLNVNFKKKKKKKGGGGRVPYKIVDFRLLLKSDLPHQSSGLPVS